MSERLHIPDKRADRRLRTAAIALDTSPATVLSIAVARFFEDLVASEARLQDLKLVLAASSRAGVEDEE